MANIDTLNSQLAAVGDAIRAKLETQDTYKISEMPDAIASISGGGDFPTITFTHDIAYLDYTGFWDAVFENYSDKLIFLDVYYFQNAFYSSKIEDLSGITFNLIGGERPIFNNCFRYCINLKKLPNVAYDDGTREIGNTANIFETCYNLREIPNSWANTLTMTNASNKQNMFHECYSLREVPQAWLNGFTGDSVNGLSSVFANCYSLNEITNFYGDIAYNMTISSNKITSLATYCTRLKNFTFKTNNGVPYSRNWKKQVLDLSNNVGHYTVASYKNFILNYNSGITADKEVTDAASYALLKNDPDWFTGDVAYSRYNHDSAVATINSLPDTSAVATGSNINTIKFKGDAGSATDGGAISTLTSAEIAVATAKGWTVTLS